MENTGFNFSFGIPRCGMGSHESEWEPAGFKMRDQKTPHLGPMHCLRRAPARRPLQHGGKRAGEMRNTTNRHLGLGGASGKPADTRVSIYRGCGCVRTLAFRSGVP